MMECHSHSNYIHCPVSVLTQFHSTTKNQNELISLTSSATERRLRMPNRKGWVAGRGMFFSWEIKPLVAVQERHQIWLVASGTVALQSNS